MAKTNYMMTVDDVAQELGVSKQKGYRIIRQLNKELEDAGYMTVQAKVPRTYWCERFYSGKRNVGEEVVKDVGIKRSGKRDMDFTDMGGGLAGKAKAQKEARVCNEERGS